MTNSVLLNGYITNNSNTTVSSDGRKRTTFTLNVQRNRNYEDENNINTYDYIPVIIYGSDKKTNMPNNYLNRFIKVQGSLVTYPNSFGKIKWGVLAKSVVISTPPNPFAK